MVTLLITKRQESDPGALLKKRRTDDGALGCSVQSNPDRAVSKSEFHSVTKKNRPRGSTLSGGVAGARR